MASFPPGALLDPNDRITLNIAGVTCKVWDMYVEHNISQNVHEQGADWTFMCLWDDQFPIANVMIGGGYIIGKTTGFANGWPYPQNPNWLARRMKITPDAPLGSALSQENSPFLAKYPQAKCVVHFGVPDFQIGQQNNTGEQELDFCSNSVPQTQTTSGLFWADHTPLPADIMLPINYTTIKFTQTVYNRTSLPIMTASSLVDHVNSGTFLGAPAGSVLFKGGRSHRKITPVGALNWDITWTFEMNNSTAGNGTTSGWNKMWKPTVGWSDFFTDSAATQKLFASGNLNLLLTP